MWLALINRVGFFYNMLVSTSVYGDYQVYMSGLVRSHYNKLGWVENLSIDSWMERYINSSKYIPLELNHKFPDSKDKM